MAEKRTVGIIAHVHPSKSNLASLVAATMTDAPAPSAEDAWLVMAHGLYYRPGAQGYTGVRDHAGRYTEAEARKHESLEREVSIIRLSHAPEFTAACWDDVARKHLQKKRDEALARATAAEVDARLWAEAAKSAARETDAAVEKLDAAEAQVKEMREALRPFAVIGEAIAKAAKDKRWLEAPLFYAGTDDDPQSLTLTGRAFDTARATLAALAAKET